jgi:hypothetical protein
MIEIINGIKKVKARKDHYCNYCGGLIKNGSIYETAILKYDDIYSWRNHLECGELVKVLKMKYYDEGLTSSIFQEYVIEEYKALHCYDIKLPSFQEILKTVIDKKLK